jgi:hypothetical protein
VGIDEGNPLGPHDLQNAIELFSLLLKIKRQMIQADVEKFYGAKFAEKFQSPRDQVVAGEKVEPSNSLNSVYS